MTEAMTPRQGTLAAALERGRDNFLLLRLLAASLVIYGHAPAFASASGWPDVVTWLGWDTYSGDLAVNVFFVISGFMITGSYLRRAHLLDFLWARVIRIYPAYLVCLLLTAFVLGAFFTTLPLHDYFRDHAVLHYVSKNAELGHGMIWTLPGVFATGKTASVNGSIWTLPAEIRMYLWVAMLGVVGILGRRWWCTLALMSLFIWGLRHPDRLPLVPLPSFVRLAAYFGLGVFCYVWRRWVPVGWFWVCGVAALTWLLRGSTFFPYVFGLALTMFIFAFAYATPWYGFNRLGDYSYGVYLWGFPVQQVVAWHRPLGGPLVNALIAWLAALVLACMSWHVVEKPALRLKNLPSRLHARWVLRRHAARPTS